MVVYTNSPIGTRKLSNESIKKSVLGDYKEYHMSLYTSFILDLRDFKIPLYVSLKRFSLWEAHTQTFQWTYI